MAKKKIDAGNLFASVVEETKEASPEMLGMESDAETSEVIKERILYIPREKLVPNPRNELIYDMQGVEELADDIQRRGIQQPLLVQRIGEDKYGILSGHSRYKANNIAFARGWAKGAVLPCVIVSDIKNEADVIEAIILNNIQRDKKTSYNKMMEIAELRRVGKIRKKEAKENNEKFSIPDYVKKWLGASDGEISKMMTIYETLGEELMADFREERISAEMAYSIAAKNKAQKSSEFADNKQTLSEYINEHWDRNVKLTYGLFNNLLEEYSGAALESEDKTVAPAIKPYETVGEGFSDLSKKLTAIDNTLAAAKMRRSLQRSLLNRANKLQGELVKVLDIMEKNGLRLSGE